MTAGYLIDTNVVSQLARRAPDPGVLARVRAHEAECALAAPTLEELAFGVARLPASARRDMLARWLDGVAARFPILSFDSRAALWLGRERARLAALGTPAPRTDGEIAAVAVVNDRALVTRDTDDFRRFQGLRVENWFGG